MIEIFESEEKKRRALELLKEYGKENLCSKEVSAEEIFNFIDEYNWDDGFEVPYMILQNRKCELATALKIFYYADGLFILDDEFENDFNQNWVMFIKDLYENIIEGKYEIGKLEYVIPLDDEDKKELGQYSLIKPVFLQDITI